jgi:hypothetical protein
MAVLNYRSPADDALPQERFGPHGTAGGWALYLGMSWTWCIGMFLPVLLVRDYGPWAWVIFAVPNVLGAAALGWTVSRPTAAIVSTSHRRAVTAFSWVTATFQVFFAAWSGLGIKAMPYWFVVPALAFASATLRTQRLETLFTVSFGLIVCSTISWMSSVQERVVQIPEFRATELARRVNELLPLAGVCTFGFLLCPYLDATFLLARRRTTDAESRTAFALGFVVFFFLMILYSLGYAGPLSQYLPTLYAKAMAFWAIGMHWLIHLSFTTGQHWVVERSEAKSSLDWSSVGIRAICTSVLGFLLWLLSAWLPERGMNRAEMMYRLFMAFYGLVFPAYVWLCMIPGRGRVSPDRRQWIVLAVAVLVAAPMYWMGFIERRMFWLLPGLSVVLLARLLIPRKYPQPAAESTNAAPL